MKGFRFSKLTLLAILGAGAAFLTFLAVLNSDDPTNLLSRVVAGDRLDLYVVQPRGTKFDEEGRLTQTFEAERLNHFPDSNHSELAAPRFHIYTKRNAIWDGTASTATLLGDSEVRLRDNVVITERGGTTQLNTSQLNYFPQQQKIDSAVAVTMKRAGDTTTAVGMRADLNTNRVELLSRVEGRHVLP
ncbi:MAG: LPS export ABC transporter periplasmic protein LptC [Spongiibacteraceae bacterium]